MSNMLSVFSDYAQSDALFQKMVDMGAPWNAQQALSMDMSYFMMRSGLKTPSTFVTLNIQPSGSPNTQRIAQILWDINGQNWKRLWDAYMLEYSPIENYSIAETIDRDQTDDRTINKKGTANETTTDKTVSELEHGESINGTRNTSNTTHGFNSIDSVPTTGQDVEWTEVHSGTDTTTTNSNGTLEGESSEDTTDNAVLNEKIVRNRAGNIGQTSYQDLLAQEFELWKWNFFEVVFEDCDRFLCLSVYDPCSSVN